MKKFLNLLLIFPLVAALMVGCQSNDVAYSGPEYVMFADSAYTMPVLETNAMFEVPVVATTSVGYDRNYAVEIVNDRTTAIRDFHFDFVDGSNNVTIKAGERVASVKLKGFYDRVNRDDTLGLKLRLVEPKAQIWDLYGNETMVNFIKCHPFRMNDFLQIEKENDEADFIMYASFPFNNDVQKFPAKGCKKDENTLMLTDMFGNSGVGDIRVIFDDSDPLNLVIKVPEQAGFREKNYGIVWIRSLEQYPSYFNTFDNFFVLLLEAYVPQIGSFGMYQYIFKVVDDDEAEDNDNGVATRGIGEESCFSTFKFNKY